MIVTAIIVSIMVATIAVVFYFATIVANLLLLVFNSCSYDNQYRKHCTNHNYCCCPYTFISPLTNSSH